MGFVIEIISPGIHEGDLALKVFEAATIIRETYGIEIIVDFVNDGLMGCIGLCGPPRLVVNGKSISINSDGGYDAREIAQLIIKLLFGELGEYNGFKALSRVKGPESSIGAIAG